MMAMCDDIDVMGYDRRRSELSNAQDTISIEKYTLKS
jgi:hypothetical protein